MATREDRVFEPAPTSSSSRTSFSDIRPTDLEYALLSQHVYDSKLEKGAVVKTGETNWKIHAVKRGQNKYFGAIYVSSEAKQIVLAHQGTLISISNMGGIGPLLSDFYEIYQNKIGAQKTEIFSFVHEAKDLADITGFHLSFTGHSLGAFLAELSVYYCHRSHQFPQVNAVTFESPGCRESLGQLQSSIEAGQIDLDQLDIISYLSYPNLVNTCNHHIGTLYTVEPDIGKYGDWRGWHLLQVHSIDNIVTLLRKGEYFPQYILDWPMGAQRDFFFKNASFEKGHYVLPPEQEEALKKGLQFELDYKGHYSTHPTLNNQNVLPLIHFVPPVQEWLKDFYKNFLRYERLMQAKTAQTLQEFAVKEEIPPLVLSCLLSIVITTRDNVLTKHKHLLVRLLTPVKIDENNEITIHGLRTYISGWLEKSYEKADKLLRHVSGIGGPSSATEPDVKMRLAAEGANLSGIEQAKQLVVYSEYPEDTDEANLKRLTTVHEGSLQAFKKSGLKIDMTAIPKNVTVTGIKSLIQAVSGVRIVPRDNPRSAASDAELANLQRQREGLHAQPPAATVQSSSSPTSTASGAPNSSAESSENKTLKNG